MPPKPCLDCNQPTTTGARCKPCRTLKDQARNQARTHYHGNWPTLSKQTREAWVNEHGWTCPGWHTPPHPSTDLTVDHITPRNPNNLQVLCRSCNSRKAATHNPHPPTGEGPPPNGH